MSPRTGRPKSNNPMNERLHIRVTKEEKDEIMKVSSESGYTLLELLRKGIETVKGQKKINRLPTTNQTNLFICTRGFPSDKYSISVWETSFKN